MNKRIYLVEYQGGDCWRNLTMSHYASRETAESMMEVYKQEDRDEGVELAYRVVAYDRVEESEEKV